MVHHGSTAAFPQLIGLFPLEGALLLPRVELPLHVFEPRYRALVDDALKAERLIGLVQPEKSEEGGSPALKPVGCLGRITGLQEISRKRYFITLKGLCRYTIEEETISDRPYRQARVNYEGFENDLNKGAGEDQVDRTKLLETFERYLDAHDLQADWPSIETTPNEALVNALSMMAPYGPKEKQALLEARNLFERSEILIAMTELTLNHGERPSARQLH